MAFGTPTFLASADGGTGGGGNDLSVTVPAGGVAAGTVLLIAINGTAGTVDGVTDTAGNTYASRTELKHSTVSCYGAIASGLCSTALVSGNLITVSFTAFELAAVYVYTLTGTFDSSFHEAATNAQMNFATAYSSGNVAPAGDAMLFGVNVTSGETSTYTPTNSFTELDDIATVGGSSCRLQTQYRSVAAGTYASTATASANEDGCALVVAVKEVPAPAGIVRPDYSQYPKPKLRTPAT